MFDVLGEKKIPKGNIIFQNVLLVFQLDLFGYYLTTFTVSTNVKCQTISVQLKF